MKSQRSKSLAVVCPEQQLLLRLAVTSRDLADTGWNGKQAPQSRMIRVCIICQGLSVSIIRISTAINRTKILLLIYMLILIFFLCKNND